MVFFFLEAVVQADEFTMHRVVKRTSFLPWLHNRNSSGNWLTAILNSGLVSVTQENAVYLHSLGTVP